MKMEIKEEGLDSIKVSKNSRGYTWEIKRYYDFDNYGSDEVIKQIESIDKKLKLGFIEEKETE